MGYKNNTNIPLPDSHHESFALGVLIAPLVIITSNPTILLTYIGLETSSSSTCSHSFLIFTETLPLVGEGNGNPILYSCLENSMDRGAW